MRYTCIGFCTVIGNNTVIMTEFYVTSVANVHTHITNNGISNLNARKLQLEYFDYYAFFNCINEWLVYLISGERAGGTQRYY